MQRVMILGAPGSGKSTLARQLGERIGLPVHHMDHIHHLPDWQPRPRPEKIAMAHAIENSERWIFEGGLSSTYDHRAARADTAVWLDLPLPLRFWRVNKRLWQNYGQNRPDMAEGCIETIGAHTWEFYIWIWQTRHTARNRIARLLADHPHLAIHHLTSPRAVARWLAAQPPTP